VEHGYGASRNETGFSGWLVLRPFFVTITRHYSANFNGIVKSIYGKNSCLNYSLFGALFHHFSLCYAEGAQA